MTATVNDQSITITDESLTVSESVGIYECDFTFDASWDTWNKTAVFEGAGETIEMIVVDNKAQIPWEVLKEAGWIKIGVYGTKGGEIKPTIWSDQIYVAAGTVPGSVIVTPTPSIYAQILDLANDAKDIAEDAQDTADDVASDWASVSATATTLSAGSPATATFSDNTFAFGIPKGAKGDTGATGATGATPDFSIGTVSTLETGQPATATITGTAAAPALNLGLPKGNKGDNGDVANLASAYSTSATYAVGDYCIYSSQLYRCTTAITTAEAWTAAHWTAVQLGDDTSDLRSALSENTIGKNLIGAENGVLYPVWLKSGDTITVSTKTGSAPTVAHALNMFDKDGQYLTYYSISGANRTITLSRDVAYVAVTEQNESAHITNEIFQLEKGAAKTAYENYFATAKTLTEEVDILDSNDLLRSLRFVQGTCTVANGEAYSTTAIKNRVRSKEFCIKKAIRITAKSGYKFGVLRKIGSAFVSTTGWISDSYLLDDIECVYVVLVGELNNNNIGFGLIDTYISAEETDDILHGKNLIGMEFGKLYPIDIRNEMYITMSTADETNVSTYVRFDFYGEDISSRTNYYAFTLSQKSRTVQVTGYPLFPYKYVRMYVDEAGTNARIQLEYGNIATEYSEHFTIPDKDDAVPKDYYLDEMAKTIASAKSVMTEPCLVFPLITDIHMSSGTSNSPQLLMKDTFRNLRWLVRHLPCDFVLNLGDVHDGNGAKHFIIGEYAIIRRNFMDMGIKNFFVLGNHDTNYYYSSDKLSMADIYGTYFADVDDVHGNPHSNGTEYYKDFEVGVRLVVLNVNYGAGGRYAFDSHTAAWLTNSALDTDNVVLLCSHLSSIPTQNWSNTNPANAADVTAAIQAFVTGGGVVVQLCGHSHADYAYTSPWTNVFSCCNKCQQADVTEEGYQMITGYVDTLVAPERTVGTVTEDCWSVVVVRPTSRKINLIRFGAGADREYSF